MLCRNRALQNADALGILVENRVDILGLPKGILWRVR
jgi:hypothetical protein